MSMLYTDRRKFYIKKTAPSTAAARARTPWVDVSSAATRSSRSGHAEAVEAAATKAEAELGPVDVWVNVAMATVYAPVSKLTAKEVERGTRVTYLGQVHGMMSALSRMRTRSQGTIVNVGSALAYRSVPLQSIYCGAKAAVRGFTDSLRSEIIHDRRAVHLTTMDIPAVNTPQFDWAMNKMCVKAKPVAPIFEPEVPARAIFFAATHDRLLCWPRFDDPHAIGSIGPER